MKKITTLLGLIICITNAQAQFQKATAPIAEKKEHWRVIHADSVADNYYWMYDYFGKGPDSTKAINYLKAENAYLDTVMSPSKPFQSDLFVEMKSRIKEKDESVPVYKNGYYYYIRTEEGKQYYKYCRKKENLDAPEEVLLDVDKSAEGHAYYAATGFDVSPDNKFMAFGVDLVSRRQYTIHIKNIETGEILKDSIQNTEGDPCWANDNKTLFYTSKNLATLLPEKIKHHSLGTSAEKDEVVYHEKDNTNYLGVKKSKNNRHIFIYSMATLSSELRMINANKPRSVFKVFQPRLKDVLYDVVPLNDKFLILTNKDGAKNFQLMECPLDKTGVSNWKEIIPNRNDVLIEGIEEFQDFIVVHERKDGLVKLRIRSLKDNAEHYLNFGEAAYKAFVIPNPEYSSNVLRYSYTSLTTPSSTYDYKIKSKEKILLKQEEVVGGYISTDYVTERIYATAKDGTKVPISLVYKKDLKKDTTTPLLLFGYGSYGISMDASFASSRLSLLDRGFVFAIAHIRGGQEMGRSWYEDGKLMKKQNTFTDFIDCGEFLIQEEYTGNGHLYAMGGSAGGLLMGAVANMAPNIWNGLVAAVPFVDVVNTMLDESIPLTTNEFDEWGNPKNEEAYSYIKSYSPYENVEKKNYPNILVTTGLHDSQVQYFEPAKWVAKLRSMKTDKNQLLFRTNMDFGHGGASGRFDYLKEIAEIYAFLFNLEGFYK
ncbi:S9 family peptidase [Arenibacter sp. BSSL-BM3]|uniref:S9 family peptidase n=1 Tax=Arenibacter arenosicollis TaxID=2762274 RepID=A0ABR7QIS2_9FLAO|nr:S9 family peptidase [Arenibacter arenosicollis]MBC8767083.1 S9 family peptidase [Arenibacter arenosicollis]